MPTVNACFASACENKLGERIAASSLLLWLIFTVSSGQLGLAEQAKAKNVPVTCSTCHAGVVASYAHAPMRNALPSSHTNPALIAHPRLNVQLGQYSYTVQTKDGQSTYTVSDGTDSLTLPIRWIFGAKSQTWVLEMNGSFYEGLVSYFHRDGVLAPTLGEESIKPHSLTEAVGRKLQTWEVNRCFDCHATNAVEGLKLKLDSMTPGVDCEHCHLGSAKHQVDAQHDNFTSLPTQLEKMNALDTANFCGRCHRTWDTVVRNGWKGTVNVRFSPYRLENSKCFTADDPRISCIACHDPHQPIEQEESFYDAKCLSCHALPKKPGASSNNKSCPVATAACVRCHMPKVNLAGGRYVFTDHEIRVVKANETYPY